MMKGSIKVNFKEIVISVNQAHDEARPDLVAYISLHLKDEHERNFICNGFTLRKSKHNKDQLYLALPCKKTGNAFFKYNLIEKTLFKEIEKEAVRLYQYVDIPIIDE